MKKYIITALCTLGSLNGMMEEKQPLIIDRKPPREPREWPAQAYDEGNRRQTSAFLHFLETNNIKVDGLDILDVGCGTGTLSAIYASTAQHVHGFDASKNMIDFAQNKYGHIKNLSFEHCFAEDFKSEKLHQLALASFCIHWFEDKKQAFQRINESLQPNSEFFAAVSTNDIPKPLTLAVCLEMVEAIDWLRNIVSEKNLTDLTGASYPSQEELSTMIKDAGFNILKCEEQSFSYTIANRDELKKVHWPIISTRPIVKYIPDIRIQPFFENFIDRVIEKLQKNKDGSFDGILRATIVHARKTQK
ncbi:MAG TPA: class I SAM-dependent methyltransferase [Candidatus Babeliales bacterium]|jgi:ubiquinone/menaquinone biosynthesis C-methylase UbiE|nr:class I SAM-dependent methyltransferase [Candidatus Babeliales bacterium]